jgi:hypothetical protein
MWQWCVTGIQQLKFSSRVRCSGQEKDQIVLQFWVPIVAFPDNFEIQAVPRMSVYNFAVNFKKKYSKKKKKNFVSCFFSALQFAYSNR